VASRTEVDTLCLAGNPRQDLFAQPQPAAPDEKGVALRIALKDQLRNIIVPRFEEKYDLRAMVTLFAAVELLVQAIRLNLSEPATEMESVNAVRLGQGYFDHDVRLWNWKRLTLR
jgi:hypothetical protein